MNNIKRIALIPSFQPDDHLLPLVLELNECGFSIVVVDDGSGETYEHIFKALPNYVIVLSYKDNHGKGYALKYGIKYIKENVLEEHTIVTLDSDGQHKVKDAIRVCEESENNKDTLVLGSRTFDKTCPRKSRFGNFMARMNFFLFTGKKVKDTQTGLRAWNNKLTDKLLSAKGDRYEYEMNVLLNCTRDDIEILEVLIETIYINNNSGSHYNPLKDTLRIFWEIAKFSLSSFIGFLVDYGVFSIVGLAHGKLVEWVGWRLVTRNVFARVISATVNFIINYKIVFKSKDKVWKAALKYAGLAIFILACNTGILYLLVDKAGMNEYLAKIIVEVIMFFVSWLVQKLFVFKRKTKKKNEK